ncbi:hypothetical protein [Alkalibacillus almallahensis]|nr:hypothetical protein [Alkalibacillus almallahensis]NIK11734.1 hypothetical protein [Alkalibacillus almallahensis]
MTLDQPQTILLPEEPEEFNQQVSLSDAEVEELQDHVDQLVDEHSLE